MKQRGQQLLTNHHKGWYQQIRDNGENNNMKDPNILFKVDASIFRRIYPIYMKTRREH